MNTPNPKGNNDGGDYYLKFKEKKEKILDDAL
jgi:hypothetical protein